MESKNKENAKDLNTISIFPLKILSFLTHKKDSALFSQLAKNLNRSKSQLSVALKKLELKHLISKSVKRPMMITITEKGKSIRQTAIKSMAKYKQVKGSEKN